MPVTIVGMTIEAPTTTRTNLDLTVPSGLQPGDVLVALHRAQSNVAESAYSGASGFDIRSPQIIPRSSTYRVIMISTRVVTNPASEPTTYRFYTGPDGPTRHVGAMVALRGLDVNNLFIAANPSYGGDISGEGVSIPAMSTPQEAVQIFIGGTELTNGISYVPAETPSGFTEITLHQTGLDTSSDGSRTVLWSGYREVGSGPIGATSNIRWVNGVGFSAASVVLGVLPPQATKLATPSVVLGETSNPYSRNSSDGSQTVTWNPVEGASSYATYIATTSNPTPADFVLVQGSTSSPFTFTGLATGTYSFGVQSTSDQVDSSDIGFVTATLDAPLRTGVYVHNGTQLTRGRIHTWNGVGWR